MSIKSAIRLILLAFIACFAFSVPVSGQSKKQVADSLRKVVAVQRALLQRVDTAGDVSMRIAVRLHLSTMVKPKEAIVILRESSDLAQAARLLEDEIAARTYLAQAYSGSGDHRKAYAESMLITALGNERLALQAERSAARMDSLLKVAQTEHHETIRKDMLRQLEVEEGAARQKTLTERWMVIALGIAAIALLVVTFLVLRNGLQAKRTKVEMAALRAEVEALRGSPQNRLRDQPPVVVAPDPSAAHPIAEAAEVAPAVVDGTLLAIFRKRGPERLSTLREARSRDDQEKVVRVIHTLKPQLVAMDAERFAPLCASLTAPGSIENAQRWNNDLDQLEAAMERLFS